MSDLLAAQRHSVNNRAEVEASQTCACFCCMAFFPPSEIVAFSGFDMANFDDPDALNNAASETALCPRCGSESVIGDRSGYELTMPFLSRMNEAWFQRTIIRKPMPKK